MFRNRPITTVLALCMLTAFHGSVRAQDAEGCKDHPLVPRLPGYFILNCSTAPGTLEAQMERGASTEPIDGTVTIVQYDFKLHSGIEQPDAPRIISSYEALVKEKGGRTIYTGSDDLYGGRMAGTFAFTAGDKDYTLVVSQMVAEEGIHLVDGYTVQVVEKKASFLEVTAINLFTAISAKGSVTLNLNFASGSAEMDEASQADVEQVAIMMKMLDSTMVVRIDGYTDNTGTPEGNKKLSASRANSVKHTLIANGVEPDRVSARGMGQEEPIADNSTEAGRAANRRVVIVKR